MSTDPECLFCKIIAGEIPSKLVYEDDDAFAFLDIAPLKAGHTLVVSKEHIADALVDPAVTARLAPAVAQVGRLQRERLGATGNNLLANCGEDAGQSVPHLHIHVVPRYGEHPGVAGMMSPDPAIDQDAALRKLTDKE